MIKQQQKNALVLALGLASLIASPVSAQPFQDTAVYTAPTGTASALGTPTPQGELSIVRERFFEATPPDVTGSGLTLDSLDTDRDGLFSQVLFVRSGPVVSNIRDPETEGAIVFPASVTVIGVISSGPSVLATDATLGFAPSLDYTATARGFEPLSGDEYVQIVSRADGTTAVEFRTNMLNSPYTDEFRVLIDHGTTWVSNLVATVEVITGDDVNIGSADGGRTGTPTSYTSPVPLTRSSCGDGIVAVFEECDGGDCCTASCTFAGPAVVCRGRDPVAFACDVPEMCTGTSAVCPADEVLPGGTVCRAAPDPCDVPETCNGSSPVCPVDGVASATTECRPSRGDCDPAELCDGRGTTCPPQVYEPMGAVCRVAVGLCDEAEVCSGVDPECPADALVAAGTTCGPVAGACDVAEVCDGVSRDCPPDAFAAMGTLCQPSTGACDPAEVCTGGSAMCPMDMVLADGASCADSLACNGEEVCSAGVCGAGVAPSCDDADACTTDMCAEPGGCSSVAIAGCCNVDGDCDDMDVCTADTCSGPGGTCGSSPITDCCVADADCDDMNSCTADSCDLATNRCARSPVAGCCTSDADCGDTNICTTDSCDVATGACTNDPIGGCCASDGDCDDGNTCTLDVCDTVTSTCTNDDVAGCCLTDADCDDSDACTTDMCNVATATCSTDRIPGCNRDGGVGFDDAGAGADAGADRVDDGGGYAADGGGGGGGLRGDAGTAMTAGGCGCRTTSPDGTPSPLWLLALGGLLLLWRRRG